MDYDGSAITYDAFGRTATFTSGASTQQNIYGADGALLLRIDSADGNTLYLGSTELHTASGSTTVTGLRTYSLDGRPIAERTSSGGQSTLMWLTTDLVMSATMQINAATGAITRRYLDPFGAPRSSATWSSDHGFLNLPTSNTTGLTHLGAREYDPLHGRFLAVDPVLAPYNPQQSNGYGYAANNPIAMADPAGTCATSVADRNDDCGKRPPGWSGNQPPPGCIGTGCGIKTSSSYWQILELIQAKADEARAIATDCSRLTPWLACKQTSGELFMAEMLDSAAGPLAGAWMYGYSDPEMYYGPDTTLVEVIRDEPAAAAVRELLRQQVRYLGDGSVEEFDVYYGDVKDLQNPNLHKDILTTLFPESASDREWVTMAIGSYRLDAYAVSNDIESRTATIAFYGTNPMTLGSAIAYNDEWRELGDNIAPASGPFSSVMMYFGWTETIHY